MFNKIIFHFITHTNKSTLIISILKSTVVFNICFLITYKSRSSSTNTTECMNSTLKGNQKMLASISQAYINQESPLSWCSWTRGCLLWYFNSYEQYFFHHSNASSSLIYCYYLLLLLYSIKVQEIYVIFY